MLDVDYARRGDLSIAYQAVGDGPVDLVFGAGLASHLDLLWGDPNATAFLRRLGQFGRLLLFDQPGTGLSDPVVGVPTLEQRAQDFLAVLDAAGSKRAVVVGLSEAVAPAALFAATYPERVEALVLVSGFARTRASTEWLPDLDDYFENVLWKVLWHSADHWGDGSFLLAVSPWFRRSSVYRALGPSVERACTSPAMAKAIITSTSDYDALPALGAVRVPTLVVHRKDEFVPAAAGRDLAERISGARFVELPGDEHLCFFEGDDIADAIGSFLGRGHVPRSSSIRALTTVLFTDIVNSTATAARLGDERWCALLAQHDRVTLEQVERHGGRVVKQHGDGALAVFDRPLMSIRCACALATQLGELGIEIRAGIHTGECDVVNDDVAGIAVHIGARVAAIGSAREVVVTSTVRDRVLGSAVRFADHGVHELKGVPGQWHLLVVVEDESSDQVRSHDNSDGPVPATAATMRRRDKAIVALAARAPWFTRPALRLSGGRRREN